MHKSQTTRSVKLRKYQVVYEACMQRFTNSDKGTLVKVSIPISDKTDTTTHRKEKKDRHIENRHDRQDSKPSKPNKHNKPNKPNKPTVVKSRARLVDRSKTLNSYQIFVKEETPNPKYKDMSAPDRLKAIGKAWRNYTQSK